jgi:sec-independent protein translocase protein TatC
MARKLLPIGHEEELSLVDHLDELRNRIILSLAVLIAVFAVCFWQNERLLEIINKPLVEVTQNDSSGSQGRLQQAAAAQTEVRRALEATSRALSGLGAPGSIASPKQRAELNEAATQLNEAAKALPATIPERQPVTLTVGEPFFTTLTVSIYFALLISMPFLLYQAYAFILPAFTKSERKVAVPLMALVPVLFTCGVIFGYFVVLPPAVQFLQTFNDDSFDILLQARDYYRFAVLALLAMGVLFQIPVGVLAATRVGLTTTKKLRRNRRYAILIIAVLAMLLPGTDPITMLIAMVPLIVLFELSILLAMLFERRARHKDAASGELAEDERD